jgi:hypothetical protein
VTVLLAIAAAAWSPQPPAAVNAGERRELVRDAHATVTVTVKGPAPSLRQAPGGATTAVAPHCLGVDSSMAGAAFEPPWTCTRSIVPRVRTVSLRSANLGIDFRITAR